MMSHTPPKQAPLYRSKFHQTSQIMIVLSFLFHEGCPVLLPKKRIPMLLLSSLTPNSKKALLVVDASKERMNTAHILHRQQGEDMMEDSARHTFAYSTS